MNVIMLIKNTTVLANRSNISIKVAAIITFTSIGNLSCIGPPLVIVSKIGTDINPTNQNYGSLYSIP